MLNIQVLKALNGDCIIVTFGEKEKHFILIDGGYGKTCYRQLNNFVDYLQLQNENIDLLILTHIDSDHISGIIHLLNNRRDVLALVKNMWFNYGDKLKKALHIEKEMNRILIEDKSEKISWQQGEDLETIIEKAQIYRPDCISVNDIFEIYDAKFIIISPTKEILNNLSEQELSGQEKKKKIKLSATNDYNKSVEELSNCPFETGVTLTNKSSIAFIMEYNEKRILMLGDADAQIVIDSLKKMGYSHENKLKVDLCKIAHHASKHNTSSELIEILECHNYIVSTKETAEGRPSKECLSRIVKKTSGYVNFYCNYDLNINKIFTDAEIEKYSIAFKILDEKGICVEEL